MKRYLSVWFPHWPMQRLARAEPRADFDRGPLALVSSGARGIRIVAVNPQAQKEGVAPDMPLADARAMLPSLKSIPWQFEADHAALMTLVKWCGRYGPQRNAMGRDGLWVDITGVAHLFGGEKGLLEDLHRRLRRLGLMVFSAIADTQGGAFALARARASSRQGDAGFVISKPGAIRASLHDLPVTALRLSAQSAVVLRRLGLFRIGQLYGLPRSGLARRFRERSATASQSRKRRVSQAQAVGMADDVVLRLDQALGIRAEPLSPLVDPPVLRIFESWSDPLLTGDGLLAESRCLAERIAMQLRELGLGARHITLSLYRTDGTVADVAVGMRSACRDADHMMRLLHEQLGCVDVGFGVDALALMVGAADELDGEQTTFSSAVGGACDAALPCLVDKLVNRLGDACVTQFKPAESHLPECAQVHVPYAPVAGMQFKNVGGARRSVHEDCAQAWPLPAHVQLQRPPILLTAPEPIMVLAQVPEGAPRRFTWRRVVHDVGEAVGPERIAPEWWQAFSAHHGALTSPGGEALSRRDASSAECTRDYYRVCVHGGASFWIYRAGMFDTDDADLDAQVNDAAHDGFAGSMHRAMPQWFLHGIYG